jgi:aryl-alcohol dehydrogenase-like predicted oxidoreductase
MQSRELVGVGRVSVVGASLAISAAGSDRHRSSGLLRHALEQGVTLVDVSGNADPRAAESALGPALRAWPEVRVISRLAVAELPATAQASALRPFLGALDETRSRLGRDRLDLVALPLEEAERLHQIGALTQLLDTARTNGCGAVGVRCAPGGVPPGTAEALLHDGIRIFLAPWNLLDREAESVLFRPLAAAGGQLLALDPHAGGRLDGQRVLSPAWEGAAVGLPLDPAALRREMEPVLALGYLTRGTRRTMIEAALRFALDPTVVAAALCPLHDPALTSAICAFDRSSPFTPEERERLSLGWDPR